MEKSLIICVNRRMRADSMSCALHGSYALAERLERRIAEEQLGVTIQRLFCLGRCSEGPVLRLLPTGEFLLGMQEEEIMERLRAFAAQGTSPA